MVLFALNLLKSSFLMDHPMDCIGKMSLPARLYTRLDKLFLIGRGGGWE